MEKNLVEKFKLFIEKEQRMPGEGDRQAYKIYRSAKRHDLVYDVCNYYKLDEKEAREILELAKPFIKNYVLEFKEFVDLNKRLPGYGEKERRLNRVYKSAKEWPEYKHKNHCKLTEEEAKEILRIAKGVEN